MSQWSEDDVRALLGELGQHGFGGLNPDEEQLRSLLRSGEEGPLQFVNLLSYRAHAAYPAGHALAVDQVVRRGGVLTLYNDVLQVLIGQTGPWDQIAIMQYPGIDAFVDMIRDPDYQVGLVHRDAGLAETAILVSRSLL